MSKILLLVLTLIIIAGGLYFVFGSKYFSNSQKYTGPVEEIRLGVSKSAPQLSTLIYIADKKGYFTGNKLRAVFADSNGR